MGESAVEKLIKRTHPQVALHAAEWAFLRGAIEGTPAAYVAANLHRYPREAAGIYDARARRAQDLCLGLLDTALAAYIGHLFAEQAVQAEGLGPAVAEFLAKPSSGEGDARTLARLLSPFILTQGIIWMAVDKPAAALGDRPLSAQEEAEAGLRPYAYIVHPTHVRDGAWGADGQLLWLLVQEDHRDDADPWASSGETTCRFRLWTREAWALIEATEGSDGKKTWGITSEGPNPLGLVPFVPFTADPVGPGVFACPGPLAKVAHLDRAALNLSSQLDEVHMMATFPQLAIPMGSNPTEEDSARALTMGLHSVIPFYSEDGPPRWVVADMAAAQELRQGIADKARQALSVALMDGDVATEGRQVQQASGVAKAFDFKKLNGALATISTQMERGIWGIARLAALWQGEVPPEAPPLDFPDDFDVRSLAEELQELLGVKAAGIASPTLTKALQKAAARKVLPKASPETLAAIDAEIDAGPDAEFDMPGDDEPTE